MPEPIIHGGWFDEESFPIPPKRVQRSAKKCVHTPQPDDYFRGFEWAQQASKTHSQVRCPHCGLWAVWLPKREAQAIRRQDAKEEKAAVTAYQRMWNARKKGAHA